MEKRYVSTIEAAEIMGISRIAVFEQIKSGKLPAQKVGRNYIIDRNDLGDIFKPINSAEKKKVSFAANKIIKVYGPALKKLGKE